MSRTVYVLALVAAGIVGGWVGYWLGYWAGWSQDADWPLRIGGGTGAVALSMALAVGAVFLVARLLRGHAPQHRH